MRDGVKNVIGSVDGYVGSQVTGLVVHGTAKGDVQATVGGGVFAAWWPDNETDGHPRPMDVTVTFTDGSTEQVTLVPAY